MLVVPVVGGAERLAAAGSETESSEAENISPTGGESGRSSSGESSVGVGGDSGRPSGTGPLTVTVPPTAKGGDTIAVEMPNGQKMNVVVPAFGIDADGNFEGPGARFERKMRLCSYICPTC